jgi:hypothetical protein
MAGVNRLPVSKFLLFDGLYAVPGVSLLFFLAYYFQSQFVVVFEKVNSYKPTIALCVISAGAGYLIRYFQEHPVSTGDPEDVPVIGSKLATTLTHGHPEEKKPESANGPLTPSSEPKPSA